MLRCLVVCISHCAVVAYSLGCVVVEGKAKESSAEAKQHQSVEMSGPGSCEVEDDDEALLRVAIVSHSAEC